jgi:hypothetical protein
VSSGLLLDPEPEQAQDLRLEQHLQNHRTSSTSVAVAEEVVVVAEATTTSGALGMCGGELGADFTLSARERASYR